MISLDDNLNPGDLRTLSPPQTPRSPGLAPRYDFPVRGYEDCRLVWWRESWWVTCTVRDTRADGRCEIALLKLSSDGGIESETILNGHWSGEHQKNWMPFVRDDELMFVYSLGPTVILRFDPDTGTAQVCHESFPNAAYDHLRGGSPLLETVLGWLGVCHEVSVQGNGRRDYLHRFFLLNADLHLQAISEVFTFIGESIEFCAGLGLETDGQTLVVSFGVNDSQAMLGQLDLERVLGVLNEANPPA